MSGLWRALGYLGGTVVVVAFFVGVGTHDCATGECDLGGLACLVVAWKRVRAQRASP